MSDVSLLGSYGGAVDSASLPLATTSDSGAMKIERYYTEDSSIVTGIDSIDVFRLELIKINDIMVFGRVGISGALKQGAGTNFSLTLPSGFTTSTTRTDSQFFLAYGGGFIPGTLIVQNGVVAFYKTDLTTMTDNSAIGVGLNVSGGGAASFYYTLDL